VVKLIEQWLKGSPQISEIHHPAGILADRTADVNFDSE
jgi:hypothetical protein